MFTKDELSLLHAALTEYYLKHNSEYEQQKAKSREKCDWHLKVMDKTSKLQSKVFKLETEMM